MRWFKKNKPEKKTPSDASKDRLTPNVYGVGQSGADKNYCSFVSPDIVFKHGLDGAVIAGEVVLGEDGTANFETGFTANTEFKKTIFDFINIEARKDPSLVRVAASRAEKHIAVIDQRTPTPNGSVPSFDIVGVFEVVDGALSDFTENSHYQVRSVNGFCDFGPDLNMALNSFLENLIKSRK